MACTEVAGIGRVVTIKDLRHTCASLMHTAGRSAKEVKEQLGHSKIAMTLDTHTHLFDQGRDPRILGQLLTTKLSNSTSAAFSAPVAAKRPTVPAGSGLSSSVHSTTFSPLTKS